MKGNICITNGDYLNYQIDDYFITTYTGELFLRREGFQNYTTEYVQKSDYLLLCFVVLLENV